MRWLKRLLFVGVLLGSALYFAPAQLLGVLLGTATHQRMVLAQPQGSLWRGVGDLWLLTEHGGERLGSITWALNGQALRQGVLGLQLTRRDDAAATTATALAASTSTLTVSPSGVQWQVLAWPIPLALITEFLPVDIRASWRDLKAGGVLQLQKFEGQATWRGALQQLSGVITWKNAELATFPVAPLGDYQLDINPPAPGEPTFDFKLRTERGALNIEGGGKVSANTFKAELTLTPDDKNKIALKPVLSFWGKSLGDDRYQIIFDNITR